jgi:hypothetical protein
MPNFENSHYMKFDLVMVSVRLAAFAPMCVLILAIIWDRRQ